MIRRRNARIPFFSPFYSKSVCSKTLLADLHVKSKSLLAIDSRELKVALNCMIIARVSSLSVSNVCWFLLSYTSRPLSEHLLYLRCSLCSLGCSINLIFCTFSLGRSCTINIFRESPDSQEFRKAHFIVLDKKDRLGVSRKLNK